MTMRWADGVTETYSHQGNGVFIDERGGVWQSNLNAAKGIWLEHANGSHGITGLDVHLVATARAASQL